MFIQITGAVAIGVIVAVAAVVGFYQLFESLQGWFFYRKPKDPYTLSYDPNSPMVKKFQYLAGITDKYGNMSYYRSRYNKIRYY